MNDLTALLKHAAGPAPEGVDVRPDVTRGHRALARVRLRHRATGVVGIAAVGAATFGTLQLRDPAPSPSVATSTPGATHVAPVRLVAQQLTAGYYTFATTPAGWAVQAQLPSAVVIAPTDGSVSSEPNDFRGKLVIMFDRNPQTGEKVTHDGRDFLVRGDSGYTTIVTRTRDGEPEGNVLVQFPDDSGWARGTMLDFLGSVTVGPDAQAGVG